MSPPPSKAARHAAAAALMCLVCTIFAGYGILSHIALGASGNAHALAFAWVRDAIGCVLLLSAAYAMYGRGGGAAGSAAGAAGVAGAAAAFWPEREDWPRLLACGLTGVWGAQGMSALVLANMNATLFAVLEQLLPVVSLLACLALGEERLALASAASWGKVLGVALAVGGSAFLALSASGGSGALGAGNANLPAGLAFIVVQLALGGSYSAVQRPLLARYPAIVVAGWGYAAGLCLLTLSVVTGATADAWVFPPLSLLAVAYAGVASSFVAYFAMATANQLAGPLFITVFFPVQPVATAVIGFFALGTRLTLEELGGAAIVSAGLLCVVAAKMAEGRELEAAAGSSSSVGSEEGRDDKSPLLSSQDLELGKSAAGIT